MLLDVLAIGSLFVIRAAAGAAAVDVRISPWLLLCTALLALFLALAKRRGELMLVGAQRTPGRPVLEGYSLELVDQLLAIVASSTVIAYSVYTFTARDSKAMIATVPFVIFGVFRYLLLVHRDDIGEEPEQVLLTRRADHPRGGRLDRHGGRDPGFHLKRGLVLVAALAVAVAVGLGLYADFGQLGDELASFRWELFPLALALTALNYLLRFWRWQRYLARLDIEVPTRSQPRDLHGWTARGRSLPQSSVSCSSAGC